ncbi:MAG TPA: S9 family peptidase, partial [Burkholderiales bacterium]|nr:S9 family peptidase [Burkholderiales bacterium]
FRSRRAAALLLVLLAGCDIQAEHPALKGATLPPLIEAHRFAYHGDVRSSYLLSPDGSKLAWTGPSFPRRALFVRDNRSGEVRKYRAASSAVYWSADSRRLLYTSDTSGAENQHVYMLDTETASGTDAVDLTPYPGVKAGIQQIVASDPGHVLIFHNRRDPKVFDLYRVDLATREEQLVARNPGEGVAPITGRDGSFKGWTQAREAQRPAAQRRQPQQARVQALRKKPEETFRVLGVGADRSFVWALSNRGRDRVALVAAHPTLGWERVVFEDPDADVTEVAMSRVTGNPLVASAVAGYPRVAILDSRLRDDLGPLLKARGDAPFGLELVGADESERRLIVTLYDSTQRRTYLVDRERHDAVLLADGVEADLARVFVPTQPVTIASRDGMKLHGLLTLPRGVAPQRLPMVLLVHGGPWRHAAWTDPFGSLEATYAQFLANRGYAVLQVNYRGSTGYGLDFLTAGIGEFAGKMQDDLIDAVRWAIGRGTADPARVAIMGWSYGGYAALVGMTQTPDTFACGVSLNGPTDLASLIESFPPYWTVDLSMWHDYVGDPAVAEDRELMRVKSPLSHARQAHGPVLIMQGDRDVRVRPDQAARMVQALRSAGRPVEFVTIHEMGHSSGWWVHQLEILRTTEGFLQRCLGGRASRFDPYDAVAWVWSRLQ